MRYVICVVLIALIASHVIKRETDEISQKIKERDEAYQQQLQAKQDELKWPE
tara:strand:+ start:75 stop:230 length:156 start_codon:yes stop_codon:yes gene_type:complete